MFPARCMHSIKVIFTGFQREKMIDSDCNKPVEKTSFVKTKNTDDAILIIVGAGHARILRHFFEGYPLFKLVEPN